MSPGDTVKVTEQAARSFIADRLSKELDPTVEICLIGVNVHEVRKIMGFCPVYC